MAYNCGDNTYLSHGDLPKHIKRVFLNWGVFESSSLRKALSCLGKGPMETLKGLNLKLVPATSCGIQLHSRTGGKLQADYSGRFAIAEIRS